MESGVPADGCKGHADARGREGPRPRGGREGHRVVIRSGGGNRGRANLVSGSPVSAFPETDFDWFPFTSTCIVTLPLGLALGRPGRVLSGRRKAEQQHCRYEEVEGRVPAGAVRRGH